MAPNYEMRNQIWKSIWPPHMPISSDVEWQKLAMDYELTGGLIKNVNNDFPNYIKSHYYLKFISPIFTKLPLFLLYFILSTNFSHPLSFFCRLSYQHFRLQFQEMLKMYLLRTTIFSIQVHFSCFYILLLFY
jgi:hypothetical protein